MIDFSHPMTRRKTKKVLFLNISQSKYNLLAHNHEIKKLEQITIKFMLKNLIIFLIKKLKKNVCFISFYQLKTRINVNALSSFQMDIKGNA